MNGVQTADGKRAPTQFDLTGRVAVVTGGTRGIGRVLAGGLAAAGARVVVASRKSVACAVTERELVAQGAEALGVPTHMGDLDAVANLVRTTVERFGALDIVVNNAANGLQMPIAELTPKAWDSSYNTNLRGPAFLMKEAHPHLRVSAHGTVLNVLSVGALSWAPGTAMYAGAKSALLAFTRNAAAEWAEDGIRVNALAPGTVDTDLLRHAGPDAIRHMEQMSLMKRIADPDEMVGPALFLVSDAASYITGQVVVADGGYVAGR